MAKLHFYYSAMNAGKSTILLQSAYNYNERGMDTLLFAPRTADRYGEGLIASRIGLQSHAISFDDDFNLFECVEQKLKENSNIRCVLVDEIHFLKKHHIEEMSDIAIKLNLPVLAYGLRSDFRGEPFEASQYLLAWAEEIVEVKTICHCGRKATMNMRIDKEGNKVTEGAQLEVGGNDRYVAVCRRHFLEGKGFKLED